MLPPYGVSKSTFISTAIESQKALETAEKNKIRVAFVSKCELLHS